MTTVLVVIRPFDTHKLGDLITGTERIDNVMKGANAHDVVRVKAQLTTMSKQGET